MSPCRNWDSPCTDSDDWKKNLALCLLCEIELSPAKSTDRNKFSSYCDVYLCYCRRLLIKIYIALLGTEVYCYRLPELCFEVGIWSYLFCEAMFRTKIVVENFHRKIA